jgi:hypothetical protein
MENAIDKRNPKAPLSTAEELKIVALLARGDTYEEIRNYFKENNWRVPNNATILNVKNRNKENLDLIKVRILEKEAEDAVAIKKKANSLLKKRLDRNELETEVLTKASQQFADGEIDAKEFSDIKKRVKEISVVELVAVSREMHTQSKATDEIQNTAPKDLSELVKAIKSGDEIKLQQIIFNSES